MIKRNLLHTAYILRIEFQIVWLKILLVTNTNKCCFETFQIHLYTKPKDRLMWKNHLKALRHASIVYSLGILPSNLVLTHNQRRLDLEVKRDTELAHLVPGGAPEIFLSQIFLPAAINFCTCTGLRPLPWRPRSTTCGPPSEASRCTTRAAAGCCSHGTSCSQKINKIRKNI